MSKIPNNLAVESTGIDFVDRLLGGGHERRKTYGLLSPTGIGKSTLATTICAEGALRSQARSTSDRRRVWVLFHLGGGLPTVWTCLLSHLALISRQDSLGRGMSGSPIGVSGYHEYEIRLKDSLPALMGVTIPEHVRRAAAREVFVNHLVVKDLGQELFMESFTPCGVLLQHLEALSADGFTIDGVVVDSVGLAVTRRLQRYKTKFWSLSKGIKQFVQEARTLIAQQYDCPVWLLHQMAGRLGTEPASTPLHHRDASECRRFGDDLDGCLALGNHDKESRCFLATCTIYPGRGAHPEPVIVDIDPDFARLRERPDAFVDLASKRIVIEQQSRINVAPEVWERVLATTRKPVGLVPDRRKT